MNGWILTTDPAKSWTHLHSCLEVTSLHLVTRWCISIMLARVSVWSSWRRSENWELIDQVAWQMVLFDQFWWVGWFWHWDHLTVKYVRLSILNALSLYGYISTVDTVNPVSQIFWYELLWQIEEIINLLDQAIALKVTNHAVSMVSLLYCVLCTLLLYLAFCFTCPTNTASIGSSASARGIQISC